LSLLIFQRLLDRALEDIKGFLEGLVTNPDNLSTYDGFVTNVRTRHLTKEELWKECMGSFIMI